MLWPLHPMPWSQLHMGIGFFRHCEPLGKVPSAVVVALMCTDALDVSTYRISVVSVANWRWLPWKHSSVRGLPSTFLQSL